MSDGSLQIQGAISSNLKANAALSALVQGVYDAVPQFDDSGNNANFPYVTIGEDNVNEFDTDTELGSDATVTIHTWSRARGRKETKQIQGAVYDALHRQSLTVAGFNFVDCHWQSSTSFLDSDGKTRHGVQTFRMLIDS